MISLLQLAMGLLALSSFLPAYTQGLTLIDMSYELHNETQNWPGNEFLIIPTKRISDGDFWLATNNFRGGEHSGTHMDAPYHFSRSSWTVEQIPIDRLIGPAAVVDLSTRASQDRNTQLTVNDLTSWESSNGPIPNGAILFVYTGWGKFWGDRAAYYGTTSNDSSQFSFPGISKEAAEWLVGKRNISGVGIDTASLDFGKSTMFSAHVTFFKANIYGLENVAALDRLPPVGATVMAFPLKLRDGTGSPVRLMATTSEVSMRQTTDSACHLKHTLWVSCIALALMLFF